MDLKDYREELDRIDADLTRLLVRRMETVDRIGEYKREHGLPVLDASREREKLAAVRMMAGARYSRELEALYEQLFSLSRQRQTRRLEAGSFGLLGAALGHSYSPRIHGLLGSYPYSLFEKTPEELEDFLRCGDWDGLNVTIPYKKTVLPFCDELSETARRIGSVNTLVRRPDGIVYGDNTDAYGFLALLRRMDIRPRAKKALVLGGGGASATVTAVLEDQGAETTVISRSGEDNYGNLDRHRDAALIVNTTPLGMYPRNGEAALDLRQFPHCEAVLDLIYNPARTALLLQAERLGIPCAGGLTMLVAQAKRSAELFTGREIDDREIGRIEGILRRDTQNIILIGMPGCGKSRVARILGDKTGRQVLEADAEIERDAGMRIPEIFAREGEEGFRRRETEALRRLGKLSGVILSTGGGCVTREENYDLLHQNGLIFWRQRELTRLARRGRPISLSRDLKDLYSERKALYERFADYVIGETENAEAAADKILEVLG